MRIFKQKIVNPFSNRLVLNWESCKFWKTFSQRIKLIFVKMFWTFGTAAYSSMKVVDFERIELIYIKLPLLRYMFIELKKSGFGPFFRVKYDPKIWEISNLCSKKQFGTMIIKKMGFAWNWCGQSQLWITKFQKTKMLNPEDFRQMVK